MAEYQGSPKTWPPLGLPVGSVRALLTLMVVGVVVSGIALRREVNTLWIETLLIALAHYYTSRRFVALPPDIRQRLENEGVLDKEQNPLFLPKHSIRFIILAAFIGLGVYLHNEGRLFEPQAIALLGTLAAYAAGLVWRGFSGWLNRKRTKPASGYLGDLRALLVLLILAVDAGFEVYGHSELLPREFHQVAMGLLLFYFGSR